VWRDASPRAARSSSLAFARAAIKYLSAHPSATILLSPIACKPVSGASSACYPTPNSVGSLLISGSSSNCANGCCPTPPGSPTSRSRHDYSWMDRVHTSGGLFITAEGLLVYLQPEEAMGLITEWANRFPGGQMIFDLPPRRSVRTVRSVGPFVSLLRRERRQAQLAVRTGCRHRSSPCTLCSAHTTPRGVCLRETC
jgi:hypothetical protein